LKGTGLLRYINLFFPNQSHRKNAKGAPGGFLRQTKNLLAGRHGRNARSARTERVCECVRVQERDCGENARVSGGKRTLSSSVCTSNDSQSRAPHRPEADASTPPRASAFCACSSSSRRRSSATFALAPAASRCAISSQSTSMAVVYYFCSSLPQKERPDTTPGTLPGGDLGHDAYSPGRAVIRGNPATAYPLQQIELLAPISCGSSTS
jgi:hypothetical protein